MPKIRVIPVILLKNGAIVQSNRFSHFRVLGNPFKAVQRVTEWDSDELIYLDISSPQERKLHISDLLRSISQYCRVPLTYGGGIQSIQLAEECIRSGADKFSINSSALERPQFISECATVFGSQCVVVSIDVKKTDSGDWEVFSTGGRQSTGIDVFEWVRQVTDRGAGEILLNSIDKDGTMRGYDTELCERVIEATRLPVIPVGGAGNWDHMSTLIRNHGAKSVAAANIFHHHENSVYRARKHLLEDGVPVRKPTLSLVNGRDTDEIL